MKKVVVLITILLLTGCFNKEVKAPVIEYKEDGKVHVISDASFTNDELDYYMFCVSDNKNSKDCKWKISISDSVDVARTGKWYFYFKGISKKGEESPISNVVYVEKTEEDLK